MTVTIGIDPHKRSHTAVAINGTNDVLGQLRVDADDQQVDRLLAFAAEWAERVWAVENANGLGYLLSRQLLESGETVVDVPAKLSARVRATRPTRTMRCRPRSPDATPRCCVRSSSTAPRSCWACLWSGAGRSCPRDRRRSCGSTSNWSIWCLEA